MAATGRQWSDLSDEELVELYRSRGVDMAFETLVRRYQDRVFRVLLGMVGAPHTAEELCQRVFVKVALRLDQLRDGKALYAWILRIANSTALDELRRNKRHERPAEPEGEVAVDPTSTHEVKEVVQATLARLSPDDRLIIILAHLEQFSIAEISEALELKPSATKMRLSRARERFKEAFKQDV